MLAQDAEAGAIEEQVDDGGGVEGEELAHDESADDGDAEGAAEFGAGAGAEGQGQSAEEGGHGGHENGAEAQDAGLKDRLSGTLAVDAFGGLDIVFNNAGIPGDKSAITDLTVEGWDRTQAVNLRSQMLAIKHAVPHLKTRGGGSIINNASGAAILPYGGGCAYETSKAGVVQMSRLLAEELGPDRIRVNAILPGFTRTSITGMSAAGSRAVADRMVGHYDEAGFAALQPFPLAGKPRYIAEAVLFLASDASVWITGVALPVDGGLLVANQRSPALGEIVGNAMELARQDVPD